MPDYMTFFDRDYLGSFDLPPGKDVIVTISKVAGASLHTGAGGAKKKKPIVFFEGKEKGLACNKTNAKAIAALYGRNSDNWVGKRVALFVGQTSFGGETMDCIRIRPSVPKGKSALPDAAESQTGSPELPAGREPGDE